MVVTVETTCTCPACQGRRELVLHEAGGRISFHICTHCMGKGRVPMPLPEHIARYRAEKERRRYAEYRKAGVDVNNINPDGSDFHIMNAIDEKLEGEDSNAIASGATGDKGTNGSVADG